ncbi:MAG TPA: VCBS repeat-containing protein [Nannocystaceae bacterium]|nr:VCBS repeat-containing protein [Nannocystaceae bacterium]
MFESPDNLPNACDGNGCWTNYLRVTDLDGDDQLDIVTVNMQGLFEVGPAEALAIYRNGPPGTFDNVSSEALGGHEGQHRQVAIGDVDGDGDPDIYAPHAAGGSDSLFINDGSGTFAETTLDNGSQAGAARFGDLDDDGDLDLVLTDGYPDLGGPVSPVGHVFANDGTGAFTELDGAFSGMLDGISPIDIDLLDVDGDFDLDAMIDSHDGAVGLWLNDGAGVFTAAGAIAEPNGVYHYNPAACDVDGDGDLDLWVDNAGPGYSEQLNINDGTGLFTDETAERVSGNPGLDDNGVVCVDLDYDGDFDAIVVALDFEGPLRYLVNAGDGTFSLLDGAIPDNGDSSLWAELGDLNGDGRLDMVTGSGEQATIDRVFLGSAAQAADATAPAFRAVQQVADVAADTAVVVHYGVTDNTVTDEGPRLSRAFVRVAVDGGAPTEVDATFMGGDLFRAEIPGQADGSSVQYTVCAVDRAGNEGCADALMYGVGMGSDSSGDATATGADTSGTASDTASATNSDATASATGASASATGADTEGTETGDSNATGDDGGGGGCGCDQAPRRDAWLAAIGLLLAFRRRRRP